MNEEKAIVEYVPFGAQDKIKLTTKMVKEFIAVPTKSGKEPTERDCMRFLGMCLASRLNPWAGDAFMIGFDTNAGPQFNLVVGIQALLKRAEVNPEYDGMESGVIVKVGDQIEEHVGDLTIQGEVLLGGWATVYFKTRKYPMRKRIKLERFKKPYGIWLDDPAGMISKCAEADALRSSFPTMLGGLMLREEIFDDKPVVAAPVIPSHIKDMIADVGGGLNEKNIGAESSGSKPVSAEERTSPSPAPPPAPPPAGPPSPKKPAARAPKKKLTPKKADSPSDRPKLAELRAMLEVGEYSEQDFLKMLRANEWDGWRAATLEELSEELISEYLSDENKDTVMNQMDQLFGTTSI
jgi:phage recombination protein Bet